MAKKNIEKKDLSQFTLDFNQRSGDEKKVVYVAYSAQNFEPKIVYEDPRQEIYKKILDREMK
jgi:hypothetical protein